MATLYNLPVFVPQFQVAKSPFMRIVTDLTRTLKTVVNALRRFEKWAENVSYMLSELSSADQGLVAGLLTLVGETVKAQVAEKKFWQRVERYWELISSKPFVMPRQGGFLMSTYLPTLRSVMRNLTPEMHDVTRVLTEIGSIPMIVRNAFDPSRGSTVFLGIVPSLIKDLSNTIDEFFTNILGLNLVPGEEGVTNVGLPEMTTWQRRALQGKLKGLDLSSIKNALTSEQWNRISQLVDHVIFAGSGILPMFITSLTYRLGFLKPETRRRIVDLFVNISAMLRRHGKAFFSAMGIVGVMGMLVSNSPQYQASAAMTRLHLFNLGMVVGDSLSPMINWFVVILRELMAAYESLSERGKTLIDIMLLLIPIVLAGVVVFLLLKPISWLVLAGIAAVAGAILALVIAWMAFQDPELQESMDGFMKRMGILVGRIMDAFKWLVDQVVGLITWIVDVIVFILMAIVDVINAIISFIVSLVEGFLSFLDSVMRAIDELSRIAKNPNPVINSSPGTTGGGSIESVGGGSSLIINADVETSPLDDLFLLIHDALMGGLDSIFTTFTDFVVEMVRLVLGDEVALMVDASLSMIKEIVLGLIDSFYKPIELAFKALLRAAYDFLQAAWNGIVDPANALIDAYNALSPVDVPRLPRFEEVVPRFETGGPVVEDAVALVHAGEYVVTAGGSPVLIPAEPAEESHVISIEWEEGGSEFYHARVVVDEIERRLMR